MKKLFTILSICYASLAVTGQTINFSPSVLGGFYARWGVGNDQWQEQSVASGQSVPNYPEPTVYYRRFTVPEVVNPNGTYYWTRFDSKINAAIEAHKKFAFRFFTMYAWPESDNFFNITPTMSGIDGRTGNTVSARSAVPLEWHTAMQAGSPRNWISESGDWVPNYNSSAYLTRLNALHAAVNGHLETGSYTPSWSATPIAYKDVIQYIDVSGFGTWGEWHSYASCFGNVVTTYPGYSLNPATLDQPSTSTFPTIATMKAIIDAHKNNYPNYQLCIIINAFDAMRLPNTKIPAEVGVYAYQTRTASGKWMGRRIDHAGEDTGYDDFYLQLNTNSFGGYRLDTASNYRHRLAPFVGEPPGGPVFYNGVVQGQLPIQARKWKLASIGNGNYGQGNVPTGAGADSVRLAFSLMGYHLRITGGSAIMNTSNFTINTNWRNFGLTPTYDHWNVEYTLRNGGGTTMWTNNSAFDPYLFSPEDGQQTKTDVFARPSLPAGTYGLYVTIKDPVAYMTPLQLQINGRDGNGSYFLGNITLGSGPTNQPPTVNAGANQSITASSATVTASASDPDGSISSYAWSRVSGPNTPTIVSASSASTNITGLIAGVYIFNVTVTDNNGATASDQVQITVNGNTPPVANAGVNQNITSPTSQVTVNGSASTDNIGITSYLWTKTAGPGTYNITSPTSVSTTITGLTTAGVYTFRLTVSDASGLTSTDDMTVTVNAGNQAPVANAGTNITINAPTSSVNLSGSLSTDDVAIVSYAWTKVGGDGTATITSPSSVNTSVTSLQPDIYIFRLTVTDAQGLTGTDDVQVTVNAAANGAPVANAGPNVVITLPTNFTQLNASSSTDDVAIVSYAWTKVSGPITWSMLSPNNAIVNAESLQSGVYVFRVTVTDAGGLTDFDDVTVTVNPVPNAAPISNAGGNVGISLPTSSTSLSGSGSTDDNGITIYLWTKVSGPTGGVITSPNTVNTNITSLQAGTYTYRLRVTDAGGLFDDDEVQITVNPAPNNAPVAEAGSPQTIQLPTSSVTLSSAGSSDDVAIVSYSWSKISGPASFTIVSPTGTSTLIQNLTAGIYFFRLTVTDAFGLTDTDDVMITVNSAVVVRPISGGHNILLTRKKFKPRS